MIPPLVLSTEASYLSLPYYDRLKKDNFPHENIKIKVQLPKITASRRVQDRQLWNSHQY